LPKKRAKMMAKTKKEIAHLRRVAELGCIVCINNGYEDTPSECHHIRSGQGRSQKASHYEVIPLCPIHHRYGGYGEVGYHQSPAEFEERYGTELELLEQVNELL
jgi:hypothetical protein